MNALNFKTWMAVVLLMPCLAAGAAETKKKAAQATPVVEPAAVDALDKMGAALRDLSRFSLVSDTTTDVVLENGQKIALEGQVNYRVERPDHLFVEIKSDRRLRQVFYDGNTLTVFSPRLKYYASVDHVGKTLGELATSATEDYGIEFPLADLFYWGTNKVSADVLKAGMHVGPATLDGEVVDQYAFRQDGVDWQVWISKATSLPQQLVITDLADPGQPQYRARLHWNTRVEADAKSFTFTPPADATRIEIVPINVAVVETAPEK